MVTGGCIPDERRERWPGERVSEREEIERDREGLGKIYTERERETDSERERERA
jgi:hypothetical protein